MKIVIAPDSFKESLTALEVANEIEAGFKIHLPDATYCKVPVADGGEGTVQSMVDATNGEIVQLTVTGPLNKPVNAFYGILGNQNNAPVTAIIEMAAASGLHHVPVADRDPQITTTYGTGELILDALNRGIKHIILGLGGSATNDAGAGMAQALGVKLTDVKGQPIPFGGRALLELAAIDVSSINPLLADCQFEVACDVDNPLCGERGASAIFGPQKGATPAMVLTLDNALHHFADTLIKAGFDDHRNNAGAGAAGGMGLGVMAFLNAQLKPGIDIVMHAVGLEESLTGADLVITGEGRIDGQTVFGKTPIGVLNVASKMDIPVIGIAGCLGEDAHKIIEQGMTAIFDIIPAACDLPTAFAHAKPNLRQTATNVAALWQLGHSTRDC